MWQPWQWWVRGDARALENARQAAVESARRRLERAEVEAYLESLARVPAPVDRHPA